MKERKVPNEDFKNRSFCDSARRHLTCTRPGSEIQDRAEGYGTWNVNASTGWQNLGPSGTWWRNQSYITSLSLTPEQQKRMDDVFQQSRIKLIDVKAALDKEEAILEPLIQADRLDENKVALQLDKVADARAELEKANARMLLGIRQVLTIEQWTKLNSSKVGFYGEALKEVKVPIFGVAEIGWGRSGRGPDFLFAWCSIRHQSFTPYEIRRRLRSRTCDRCRSPGAIADSARDLRGHDHLAEPQRGKAGFCLRHCRI